MGKFLFKTIIIIVFMLSSCSRTELREMPLEELAPKTTSVHLQPDSLISGAIANLVFINDSTILLADMQSQGIFKINVITGSVSKIGENGTGPGEYVAPYFIHYEPPFIYFSDITNLVIQKIDSSGKFIEQFPTKIGGRTFLKGDNFFYYFGSTATDYFLYDVKSGLGFIETPLYLRTIPRPHSTVYFTQHKNFLYIINFIEPIVYQFDLQTRGYKTKKIKNWPHVKNYRIMELGEVGEKDITKIVALAGLDKINYHNHEYYIIYADMYTKSHLYLMNSDFEIEKTIIFNENYMYIPSNHQNRIVFFEFRGNDLYLHVYQTYGE